MGGGRVGGDALLNPEGQGGVGTPERRSVPAGVAISSGVRKKKDEL